MSTNSVDPVDKLVDFARRRLLPPPGRTTTPKGSPNHKELNRQSTKERYSSLRGNTADFQRVEKRKDGNGAVELGDRNGRGNFEAILLVELKHIVFRREIAKFTEICDKRNQEGGIGTKSREERHTPVQDEAIHCGGGEPERNGEEFLTMGEITRKGGHFLDFQPLFWHGTGNNSPKSGGATSSGPRRPFLSL